MDSSVPEDCLTISTNTGVIAQNISTLGNITTSGSGGSYYTTGTGASATTFTVSSVTPTMTINSSGSIGIGTISSINISGAGSGFTWNTPEEFVNALPDLDRIQKMCDQYPGFKIAFEKFKTTYYLVKDDYDTPEDKRPKP